MPRSARLRLPEFVRDLMDVGRAALAKGLAVEPAQVVDGRVALTPEQIDRLMMEIAREFCWRNAKSTIYLPEARLLARMDRDTLIWQAYQADGPRARRFTRERVEELAGEWDLTIQMVYRILAVHRDAEVAKRQGVMPGLDPAD